MTLRSRFSVLLLVASLLVVVACRGGAPTPPDVKIPLFTPTTAPQRCVNDSYPATAPQFAGDQFAYTTLASGLKVYDIVTGDGDRPAASSAVAVRYSGFLPDGCVFTTTYLQNDPVQIDLETAIPGVVEGLTTMNAGGTRRLRIPSELAYGEGGFPGRVPRNSEVIFVFELVDPGPVSEPESGTPAAGQ